MVKPVSNPVPNADLRPDWPAPEPEVKERKPETMHDREHLGQEVASDLTLGGMGTFLSAGARGVNLLAANAALTATMPVRIIVDTQGIWLKLKPDEAKLLTDTDGVVAFLLGEEDDRERFYLPVAGFLAKAVLRDGKHAVEFSKHARWLQGYEGHAGVKRAFAKLIKKHTPKVEAGG